jgi:hypothetical protein
VKIEKKEVRARLIRSIVEKHATLCFARLEFERRASCHEFDNKKSIDEFRQKNVDEQKND